MRISTSRLGLRHGAPSRLAQLAKTLVPLAPFTLAALAALTFAPDAEAQVTGFGVNHFEPSDRGSDWFALDSVNIQGKVRPAIGLDLDAAYRPLVLYNSDGTIRASIVRNQIFLHPGASLVLFDRLRLAVNVPVQVFAEGRQGVLNGVTYPPPQNKTTVGDVRLGADVRLVGEEADPFRLAIGGRVWIPSGEEASYAGDDGLRVGPRVLAAGDVDIFAYAAEVDLVYRADGATYGAAKVGTQLTFGISAGLHLLDRTFMIGPEVYGHTGVYNGDAVFAKADTPVEGMLGAHYLIANQVRVGAGIGTGFTRGYGAPVSRTLVNLEWAPGLPKAPPPPTDSDGDGIPDGEDACPREPGVRTDDPKTNGCPSDRDEDGVPDAIDACPDVAGEKNEDPRLNGCPPDKDKDGIPDEQDACPDVAGVKSDDPKLNGCPPDKDKDGIIDAEDACPEVPGLKSEDPKLNGCPDPDRDKDGVPNDTDACPDEPGKPDPNPKRNGCPKAFVKEGQIRILDQVRFKTNSATIDLGKDSSEVLQAVMEVLTSHPEITLVRVEGHTDNKGAAAYNKTLSGKRAASVVKWLVAHGIDKGRLDSIGYGAERPIESNDTDEGRTANRRVEFHIEGRAPASNEAASPSPGGGTTP